ncbi:ribokinase [Adhaeribacter aerolatus]|uniref:Ribokinase n=1 Tax=Adhaeribacter aerolatus TaxID=670289 RepID=A0A512B3D7_9BACT|nr:carbohydrate kinase family protein [Adhaeribacter aerolatus]GEO06476.1 ribokinase [Adhaeribacter aerolatus]
MKAIDVIVVGELNVDLILNQIGTFPEVGKEILAQQMTLTLGSSSAIFASNLSSLGAKVAFIGKIGQDPFGEVVLQSLQAKGVDTSLIIQSADLHTGATVVLNFDEDRAMVTHPGAMNALCLADISPEHLSRAKHLHFSSYFLQPGLQKEITDLFRLAKALGLTTSFDTQWDPQEKWDLDLAQILPYVDVFLPNEKELFKLTRTNSLTEAIAVLPENTRTVLVKMGNKGSVSWCDGKLLPMEPFLNEDVVDAIGAGDSFNAGFIYKYIQGASVEECQRFGNLTGAVSTTAAGGTTAFTDYNKVKKIAQEKFGYAL